MKRWIIVTVAAVLLGTCAGYALIVFAEYRQVVGPHQEQLPFSTYQGLKSQALAEAAERFGGRGVVESIVRDRDGPGLIMWVVSPSGEGSIEFLLVNSNSNWSISHKITWLRI